jgi:hypothetical protein
MTRQQTTASAAAGPHVARSKFDVQTHDDSRGYSARDVGMAMGHIRNFRGLVRQRLAAAVGDSSHRPLWSGSGVIYVVCALVLQNDDWLVVV